MQFPFKIIESRISRRNEFDVKDGFQPTHALFYLKKGRFEIEIDGITHEICSGDCFILPDHLYFQRSVINPIEFVYVKFTDNLSCPYSLNIPYGKVEFEDKKRFHSNIAAIEALTTCDDALSVNYREHLLTDILFQINHNQKKLRTYSGGQFSHNKLVASAITFILENIEHKILIKDICKAIGTNSSSLNFNFRRELNMSVAQFIMDERMKSARHFLIGTTYSISEIATRCGFENVFYFSNAFKKAHGICPSEYKYNHD